MSRNTRHGLAWLLVSIVAVAACAAPALFIPAI